MIVRDRTPIGDLAFGSVPTNIPKLADGTFMWWVPPPGLTNAQLLRWKTERRMLVMAQDVKRTPSLRTALELARSQLAVMGEDSIFPDAYRPKPGEFVPTLENMWNAGLEGVSLPPLQPGETGGVHAHGFDPLWNQPPQAYTPPGPAAYDPPSPPVYTPASPVPLEEPEDNSTLQEIVKLLASRGPSPSYVTAPPTSVAAPSSISQTQMLGGVGAVALLGFLAWRMLMK